MRRILTVAAVALLVPVLALAGENPRNYRFTSGHSALQIPFEEDDGHIFLQVRINDSAPVWFGLDTGAIRSIVDTRWVQKLGLSSAGSQRVGGAGGYEEGSILQGLAIKLPGVELRDQTAWGLPLDAVSAMTGRDLAGILGYEIFSYFVVDIDYEKKRISLHDPDSYRYRGPGESIPIVLQDREAYVRARVILPGRNPIAGEFVIDTGGNSSLMLAKSFVDEHALWESLGPTLEARGRGVGGEIQLLVGRAKSLGIGRFVVERPITNLMKTGEIAAVGKAGNLGGRILRRFRCVFDYSRRRVILEPNAYFSEPDEVEMTGAALMPEGPAFVVARVREGSPAAEAGLRPQDVITAVDGQPAAAVTFTRLKQMFRQDGRVYRLGVKRGEQTLQVRIKLRRLI